MILRFGLKFLDFLGKMKAEKFASTAVRGYVPNHERNHFSNVKKRDIIYL